MIVTTALKQEETLEPMARQVSEDLHAPFVPRKKKGLNRLRAEYNEDIIIVGLDKLQFYPLGCEDPIFFHPNIAMLRYKRLIQGKEDPLIVASQLEEGMSFLDCTLGLASDCIIASLVVGHRGRAVGIEGHPVLAYMVTKGLKNVDIGDETWTNAINCIEVHHSNHLSKLKELESDTFDVVYFDPMFETTIDESSGIKPLRTIALYEPLTNEIIQEAIRVSKSRVVLKDHYQSNRFTQFGFQVIKRKTSLFHYGYIEKGNV